MASHRESSTVRAPHENPEKNPENWATGDEPMTGPQRSYLTTLCQEAGEEFNESLTKAEASKKSTSSSRRRGVARRRGTRLSSDFIQPRDPWHSREPRFDGSTRYG
jgi:hypothetical protein